MGGLIQSEQEQKNQLSFFIDDMTVKNPKEQRKKL